VGSLKAERQTHLNGSGVGPPFSGEAQPIVTAGDVVFTGRNDGRFVALDSRNGDVLCEFQTGAGVNATASVFQHNGHLKVAVVSAGNNFAGSPAGDPDITKSVTPELVANTVISGKNNMPPFAAALTFAQIRDVAAYVAAQLGK
jgi:outer membrane protein assembly factor BamB